KPTSGRAIPTLQASASWRASTVWAGRKPDVLVSRTSGLRLDARLDISAQLLVVRFAGAEDRDLLDSFDFIEPHHTVKAFLHQPGVRIVQVDRLRREQDDPPLAFVID